MLLFLFVQVGTGLLSDDEIAFAGPLTALVSNDTVANATWYHKDIGALILIAMASLHVRWRGPLAFLRRRDPDGRVQRLVFWPDTLPVAARRELKLAMQRRESAAGSTSMAG